MRMAVTEPLHRRGRLVDGDPTPSLAACQPPAPTVRPGSGWAVGPPADRGGGRRTPVHALAACTRASTRCGPSRRWRATSTPGSGSVRRSPCSSRVSGVWQGFALAARLAWRRLLVTTYAVTVAWTSRARTGGRPVGSHARDRQPQRVPADRARDPRRTGDAARVRGPHPGRRRPAAGRPTSRGIRPARCSCSSGWWRSVSAARSPSAPVVDADRLYDPGGGRWSTLRRLGAEDVARRVAPFLVLAPAAIWVAVSADGVFAAVAAWGLAAVARPPRRTRPPGCVGLGSARRTPARRLPAALLRPAPARPARPRGLPRGPVVATVPGGRARRASCRWLGFAALGFRLWTAYPALHDRYWAGHRRRCAPRRTGGGATWPPWPSRPDRRLGAGLGSLVAAGRRSPRRRTPPGGRRRRWRCWLADASQMSKAEVERIWLPFVPWLLLSTACLPERWRRPAARGPGRRWRCSCSTSS